MIYDAGLQYEAGYQYSGSWYANGFDEGVKRENK